MESGAPPIMPDVDAYLVLYSVADNKSFQAAETKLSSLNKDLKRETAVILVANKSDIVRNRTVTADGKYVSLEFKLNYSNIENTCGTKRSHPLLLLHPVGSTHISVIDK